MYVPFCSYAQKDKIDIARFYYDSKNYKETISVLEDLQVDPLLLTEKYYYLTMSYYNAQKKANKYNNNSLIITKKYGLEFLKYYKGTKEHFSYIDVRKVVDEVNYRLRKNSLESPITTITNQVTDISFNSAFFHGKISSYENNSILNKGFCYSKFSKIPTIENSLKIINTSAGMSFSERCTNLESNTTYYIRSFATNNLGTSYSDVIEFRTKVENVKVEILSIKSVSTTTVTLIGSISDEENSILEKGVCYSYTSLVPDIKTGIKVPSDIDSSIMKVDIENLLPNTKYYYVFYVRTKAGIYYSKFSNFTTASIDPKPKTYVALGYEGGSIAPYGLRTEVMFTSTVGIFANARSSLVSNDKLINKYSKKNKTEVIVGPTFRIASFLNINLGLGGGYFKRIYRNDYANYLAVNNDKFYSAYGGTTFIIKRIHLSIGSSFINDGDKFYSPEYTFGLSFKLN